MREDLWVSMGKFRAILEGAQEIVEGPGLHCTRIHMMNGFTGLHQDWPG